MGNMPAYALNTLKTAVPSVDLVYNREEVTGGQDQEPLEIAKLHAPEQLHAQNRAVTAADYEYLATRADVAVGRVKCLQHEPGWVESVDPGTVYLFVLPEVKRPKEPLTRSMLTMPAAARQQIKVYLDERRLLTTRLHVTHPDIVWVQVNLTCKVRPGIDKKKAGARS
jgi:predicted phage baseplate assembly protein